LASTPVAKAVLVATPLLALGTWILFGIHCCCKAASAAMYVLFFGHWILFGILYRLKLAAKLPRVRL
jgi:hypothetical protein